MSARPRAGSIFRDEERACMKPAFDFFREVRFGVFVAPHRPSSHEQGCHGILSHARYFFLTAAHRLAKNGAPGVKTGQFRKGSGDIM
jgi:hypothetical protein